MSTLLEKRAHAERTLEAIEAVLEGRATHDVSQYQIGDQLITKMPLADLLRFKANYRAEIARINEIERQKAGLQSRRFIGARFS